MEPGELLRELKRKHGIGPEKVVPIDSKKGVPPLKGVVSSNRNTDSRYYGLLEGVGRNRSHFHLVEVLKLISDMHAKRWLTALKAMDTDQQNVHLDAFNGLGSSKFQEQRRELAERITLFLHEKQEMNEKHLASLEDMARQARGVKG